MSVHVFCNGPVFAADRNGTVSDAVAVEDGRIAAVGSEAVQAYVDRADEVTDLTGRMLVPGFVDAHVHPVMGGLERTRCDLTGLLTVDAYQGAVARYATDHPDAEWILGGGWSMEAFPNGRPTRQMLDSVMADRPVLLPNRDHHSSWANSRALELAGIDRRTPDPADGRIERDHDGVPTGALHEGAMDLVGDLAPPPTDDDLNQGLLAGQSYLHSLGIVGWADAWTTWEREPSTIHAAYLRADAAGRLTARVSGALWWHRDCSLDQVPDQVARLVAVRDAMPPSSSGRYRLDTVKIMQDGVAETFTAALLEPYLDGHGRPTPNAGLSFLPPEVLGAAVRALTGSGFSVHFHALGDRAVRECLDAVQSAQAGPGALGQSNTRHQLAHLQLVHPDDVRRFAELGVTANMQALWATHEPQMDDLTLPFLGEARGQRQYPFADLHAAGAALAMGSDWPVSTPDPWAALHVAVNRVLADAPERTPPLGPDQALPLEVALRAYTAGSARAAGLAATTGTVTPGRAADLVVLDRDPFTSPPGEIGQTRVVATYVAGEAVYRT